MKKNKQKKGRKIFLKVIASLLAVIVLFIGITAIITAVSLKSNIKKANSFPNAGCEQIKAENIADGYWNIYFDGEMKVIQLSDVHLGGGWMSINKDRMSLNAVAAMITAEKPDFVMVTGDIAYPVPFQAGTFNNKSGAKLFAELMESLGVYWTASFGNHDTEAYSYFSREEITEFYSAYPHCLLREGADGVDGSGNQVFNIVNSDGIITRSLFTLDTHSYIDGDYFGIAWKYDGLHENQINWYAETVKQINAKNAETVAAMEPEKAEEYANLPETVPSSVFIHIPFREYRDAWTEYAENGYADTSDVKQIYGTAGESGDIVYCSLYDDNFFETMQELGSTDSVFCGHDHLNNFSLEYKGIRLNYTFSVDYLAYTGIYKLGSQRGCTVITIGEDGSMESKLENYYQEKYESFYEKEDVTMQELLQK
ncbi:MAG: metallophosphoesterase [Acutalibacteraceae bacterium]